MNSNIPPQALSPITEDDIADYLLNTPDFFKRHAELLASVQLVGPHGGRAISLQERQALMLREKIKQSEAKVMGMIRNAHDNMGLEIKLQSWLCDLLKVRVPVDIPHTLTTSLCQSFDLPYAVLRLWDLPTALQNATTMANSNSALSFTWAVNPVFQQYVSDLLIAFCGKQLSSPDLQQMACELVSSDPAYACEAELSDAAAPVLASLALLPIRAMTVAGGSAKTCGLLLLGSDQADRFTEDMGLEFLQNFAALANSALSRLYAD
jgi:uncharacterized protein YigA (DUF484 family)